jgi:hypothetical protein
MVLERLYYVNQALREVLRCNHFLAVLRDFHVISFSFLMLVLATRR